MKLVEFVLAETVGADDDDDESVVVVVFVANTAMIALVPITLYYLQLAEHLVLSMLH